MSKLVTVTPYTVKYIRLPYIKAVVTVTLVVNVTRVLTVVHEV